MEARTLQALETLRQAMAGAGRGLVERDLLLEAVTLGAVAGEHLLVIGPPGTAKSEAVRRMSRALNGRYFEYLIGRFTEPSEIFGPVDLRKLREGVVETETRGMLPEAEIAFLDEVFLGSTAILNTLLGILNERMFRRGHTQVPCPLRVCVGASNALPSDELLAAFADRFLVRVFVDPIPDPSLEELLEGGWQLGQEQESSAASMADLDCLAVAARQADLSRIRTLIAHAIRLLRGAGIQLTDRRAVKSQRLIAAAATLAGRDCPTEADLWPLVLVVPTKEEQVVARETLRDLLSGTENATLQAVAEDASQGPLARAARIAEAGRELLREPPVAGTDVYAAWLLKLEGVAREIDAGFAPEQTPESLAVVREQIVQAIRVRQEWAIPV